MIHSTPRRLAIALVHYPVLDRENKTVTSAITNIDIHDLSRTARTFGATDYFITTPIEAQRQLVQNVVHHWTEGSSGRRIPSRKKALELVRSVPLLEDAIAQLGGRSHVELWATAASQERFQGLRIEHYSWAHQRWMSDDPRSILVIFGTSWGLTPELVESCDAILPPIYGIGSTPMYNHLSVRSACAIVLDRITGHGLE